MARAKPGVVAFSGGPLVGTKLVRVIYIDETGHSYKEPVAAVAGIILDPDKQWRLMADEIEALKQFVPEAFREGFVFHATDLFYGGKYRRGWPDEDRWSLLENLVALPRKLKVPLVLGCAEKPAEELRNKPQLDSVVIHVLAYLRCLKSADTYMKDFASPDEVAMIVAEERKEAREAIRAAHNLAMSNLIDQVMPSLGGPITRIKTPPAFASKEEEILLQIADACAWTFQRHLRGGEQSDRYIHAMFGDFAHPVDLGKMRTERSTYYGFAWAERAKSS
jgi:Protein of unknown function (DUF3800)